MKKIICPKCGEIDFYTNFEIQKVYIAFDADGNEIDAALEDMGIRSSTVKRCCYCQSKVKIEESEGTE